MDQLAYFRNVFQLQITNYFLKDKFKYFGVEGKQGQNPFLKVIATQYSLLLRKRKLSLIR